MRTCILLVAAIGLMQTAAAFAQEGETAVVDDERIKALIGQLESESFSEREAAVAELTKIGPPAIAALTAAAQEDRVETRFRALSVLVSLYRADDAAASDAAKAALEKLRTSDNESTRAAAEKILAAPQYELPPGIWQGQGRAAVFGGERPLELGGEGGVAITGAGIRIGSGGQLILARGGGGERRIDLIKGTGHGLLLLENPRGIEIHVRTPQEKGDPQFTRYQAKNAEELAEKHPKIHKLYQTLDVYQKNQTIIGGVKIDF